ncbi:DinB family protein [Rhodococcus sp. HNM0569]|uniref:DinB family protein n=1 Tax=Rhodococcus sp. HNM0569 TaxID=2716340 RepID=UPI00146F00B9|nr:DinB family protein [Rhodococcus sp. HNM0569]NLU82823.1 DinB family protein [Rhodococcus sp. HNM0569]
MAITPDGKDWTWVLDRPCPECGFDASTVVYDEVPTLTRRAAAVWSDVLRRTDVATRPDPSVWSPLEYSAHVRDVCRIFTIRLALMLSDDEPVFADWDQDATAVRARYNHEDPAAVAVALTDAADAVASGFAGIDVARRDRVGLRSDGHSFTVESLARYFVHDPIHHLHDVGVPWPGRAG